MSDQGWAHEAGVCARVDQDRDLELGPFSDWKGWAAEGGTNLFMLLFPPELTTVMPY